MQMEGREIGYNKHAGTNARQIVPVTDYTEVSTGSELDILLYLNNYDLIEPGQSCMDVDMSVDDALDHFRKGARVAAGSTQTHRGKVEISYWANPFPLLKDKNWDDLIGTNLKGPLFLCQAAHNDLKKQQGSIINLSSIDACN